VRNRLGKQSRDLVNWTCQNYPFGNSWFWTCALRLRVYRLYFCTMVSWSQSSQCLLFESRVQLTFKKRTDMTYARWKCCFSTFTSILLRTSTSRLSKSELCTTYFTEYSMNAQIISLHYSFAIRVHGEQLPPPPLLKLFPRARLDGSDGVVRAFLNLRAAKLSWPRLASP